MTAAIVLLVMIGIISTMTTTKESRAAARVRFARWNPLFMLIIVAELAVIFWPWR